MYRYYVGSIAGESIIDALRTLARESLFIPGLE